MIQIYNLIYKALSICLRIPIFQRCSVELCDPWLMATIFIAFFGHISFSQFFFIFKGYDNSDYWNSINDLLNRQEQVSK